MRILTKEIDKYKSLRHKSKMISQFIIYLMAEDVPIEAYLEFGIDKRDERIDRLITLHKITDSITNQYIIN